MPKGVYIGTQILGLKCTEKTLRMIYARENKFFLYKCILLDGLLYFNPKIKITWRITGETGEVGLCIKISMPKGSTIPQYIFVCILCIFTYICGNRFKGDMYVTTSSSKMCSFGKIATCQRQDGGPGLSILGYISLHTWTHAPTHTYIYIYTSFIQTCLSEGVTTALVLTWFGK